MVEICTGLYGRKLITLARYKANNQELPNHRMTPGATVGIVYNASDTSSTNSKTSTILNGIVFKTSATNIQVAVKLEELEAIQSESTSEVFNLVEVPNAVT